MKKILVIFFCVALSTLSIIVLGVGGSATTRPNPNADSFAKGPTVDTSSVIVQLKGDPLSTYAQTKPPQGRKIDFNSNTVKSYRAQLSALRNDFQRWLQANARQAKITSHYDISLNAVAVQLNGAAKSTIERAPQVARVEYQGIYYPNQCEMADPDLGLISAIDAWNHGGGPEHAGEGVKVAVIDTGIDITHPCFDDTGYPPQPQLGDTNFTNNKVVAAKVFINRHGFTPEAIQAHGTHVSGTVGCNFETPATVSGVEIPYCPSGVAPRVLLGNYNVFPGDVASARSEDILNALETAYADGFDIANLSLGGGIRGIQDLLTDAIDDLDQAGFISAVSAGNTGPGFFTVGSPGSAARALTAGAVTVGHFMGADVTDDTSPATFAGAIGAFGPYGVDTSGPLSADLGDFCTASGTLTGQIALIERGTCTFSTKIRNAQDQGAIGAIIVNNVFGPPIAMGSDGTPNQPTIPAVMVSKADLGSLSGRTGNTFTIHSALSYVYNPADNDFLAGFSSRGPTDVDFRVKPDVTSPGVNVLSSFPTSFCGGASCWAFLQGTSMAAPHLAGSAAVVKGQHPTWSAAQIRSSVVNTADATAVKDPSSGDPTTDANSVGSGRENLESAVTAIVVLDPVSVSFGSVPAGSRQTKTLNATLTNLDSSSHTFSLSVDSITGTGVGYSVTPSLTLAAGASGTVTVTMTADRGASRGFHQGTLNVSEGGTLAHAAVFTNIK
jgi:minor extracellular serine protease Vpr